MRLFLARFIIGSVIWLGIEPGMVGAQGEGGVVKQRIAEILQEQTTAALRSLQTDLSSFEDVPVTDSPTDLITQFCAETLGRALSANCSALGETADADPLRLSRAVAFARGDWSAPSDDTPETQSIAVQVAADAAQLRNAIAQASRKDDITIFMAGRAEMPVKEAHEMLLEDLFPDGVDADPEAVEAAVTRILTTPGLTLADTGRLIEELRSQLPQADQNTGAAPAELSGLVGDPLVCDDLELPADLRPFEDRLITLPEALHGAEDLMGVMLSDIGPQMVLLTRQSPTQARIYLPMHASFDQNQDVGLVLMFADGPSQIARRCNMQVYSLAPPAVTTGAFPALMDDLVTLMEQSNTLAEAFGANTAFPEHFIAEQRASLNDLRMTAYAMGSAEDKFMLDAMATSLLRLGINPGQAAGQIDELLATRRSATEYDEGHVRPRPIWPSSDPQSSLIQKAQYTKDGVGLPFPDASLFENQCPTDMYDLQRMMNLQYSGAFADRLDSKILLGASSALASMSAGLLGSIAHPKLGEYSARAVGTSSALYGIYLSFLKGMLPSTLVEIRTRVANPVIYEDEPDKRVEVKAATLVTRSEGFDLNKAVIDATIGLAGLKGAPSGPFSQALGKFNTTTITKGLVGPQAFKAGGNLFRNQSISLAVALFGQAGQAAASVLDGELVNFIYANINRDTQAVSLPPQTCMVDMLDEKWALITLEDRDVAFEYERFGVYRGLRDGVAKLKVELSPFGLVFASPRMPISLTTIRIPPLQPLRLDSPGAVVPGESFSVKGGVANSASPNTKLLWELEPTGVVSSFISPDTTQLTAETSRSASNFPVTGKIGVTGTFLPNSEAENRRSAFAVQAGGLWLVPSRNCISPGGAVQIFVIDSRSGERVPPQTLVFHTDTAGITIDGDGLLRSTKVDRNVTIYARGVGANGYRGQVTIRADCTCGVEYFDPDIVVPANSSGPAGVTGILDGDEGSFISMGNVTSFLDTLYDGPDIFAIDGDVSVLVSGDVNLSYSRPLALDLMALQTDGPYGPSCSYMTTGISIPYLGTQMLIATPGGLMAADGAADLRANTYRSEVGFSLEDFGGPDDFGMLHPQGGMSFIVHELEPAKLKIEVNGRIKGFKYIPFLEGLREDISANIRVEFVSKR